MRVNICCFKVVYLCGNNRNDPAMKRATWKPRPKGPARSQQPEKAMNFNQNDMSSI